MCCACGTAQHLDLGRTARRGGPPVLAQGLTILAARRARSWSQCKLALALGVDRSYVSYVERGKRCLAGRMARRVSVVVGIEVPLPAIDPKLTADGRQASQEARRQARGDELRRLSVRHQTVPHIAASFSRLQ